MADGVNFYAEFCLKASIDEVDRRGDSFSQRILSPSNVLFNEEKSDLHMELSQEYQEFDSICQMSTLVGVEESPEISDFSGEKVAVNDLTGVSSGCLKARTASPGRNVESGFVYDVDHKEDAFDYAEENCEKSMDDVKLVDSTDKKDFEAPRLVETIDKVHPDSAYDENKDPLEKESEEGSFLETKKKLLLKELEVMLVLADKPHKENVTGSNNFGDLTEEFSEKMREDEKKSVNKDTLNLVKNEVDYMNGLRRSLRIEVVDETALIDSTLIPQNGNRMTMDIVSPAEPTEKRGMNDAKKEIDAKKKKRPRRKGKESKKNSDKLGEIMGYKKNAEGSRRIYSREDMEALRFTNAAEQRKLWAKIYNGLTPSVAKEYDDLASFKHQNPTGLIDNPPLAWTKNVEAPAILGEARNIDVNHEEGYGDLEEECEEDVDSDEDFSSIQRVAFMVDGEPNFESGPPEDGLEYLRRVRWEAARVPKVKVAKVDRSKFSKEQSAYMPQIPSIPKCPQHLLPLKQWEDAFLQEFSDLRLALSGFETSQAENAGNPPPEILVCDDSIDLHCDNSENLLQNTKTKEKHDEYPMLSTILGMDSVSRASMLRKRISLMENSIGLTRSDCVWIFALCAAVDEPLDADGCAALRSLLRKCGNLRAGKSEVDEEIIMLNILVTISGRYFGQWSES